MSPTYAVKGSNENMEGRRENNGHLSRYSLSIVPPCISLSGRSNLWPAVSKSTPNRKWRTEWYSVGLLTPKKGSIVVSEETLAGIVSALGNAWCHIFVLSFGSSPVCCSQMKRREAFPCHVNPGKMHWGGRQLESLKTRRHAAVLTFVLSLSFLARLTSASVLGILLFLKLE